MEPMSPLPALAAVLLALATAAALGRRTPALAPPGRYAAIDGLRGYLALGVFLHHGAVWFGYLRSGQWQGPPSALYGALGQHSVTLFFMITGFLFYGKLLDGRRRPVDWLQLYLGRVLRLLPLYLLMLALMTLCVCAATSFTLQVPLPQLAKALVRWLSFGFLGRPDLNGYAATAVVTASVAWSLLYEWLFYLTLPLLALLAGVRPPLPWLALGGLAAWGWVLRSPPPLLVLPFVAGMAAAHVVRWPCAKAWAGGAAGSVAAAVALLLALLLGPGHGWANLPALLALALAFGLIACGATLFGALTLPSARLLGEQAYSLYLLHGLTLFVTFTFVIGQDRARHFSAVLHWLVILGLTPALVLLCHLSQRTVEAPPMRHVRTASAWLRARLPLRHSS